MNICKKLWHNVEVDLEGQFQPCSSFQGSISCQSYDLESYYASADFQRIILQHQEGIQNPECALCWQQEQQGNRSLRQSAEDHLPPIDSKPGILVLDYSLDHICNLKCLMCNETASSAILAEKKSLGLDVIPIRLSKDSIRLDFLKQHISNLKELNIYNSGEPTLSPLFEPLISLVLDKNPNLNLMISTNCTRLSDSTLDLISQLNNITIKVSVDGFDRVNDFIRYPSEWSSIENNVKRLQQLPNVKLIAHTTVQALNILKLKELLDWTSELNLDLELSTVKRTPWLDIEVLPSSSRAFLESKLSSMIKSKPSQGNLRLLLSVLKQLQHQPVSESSREHLIKLLQDISRVRKINPRDYIAEELELLEINT